MKLFESKLFTIIGLFIISAITIILAIAGVRPSIIGCFILAGAGGILGPRFHARQISQETVELDANGQTMLFNAYLYEDAQRYLESGTDISATDFKGQTPLHTQVDMDHVDIVRLLLSYDANPNAADNKGQTPLFFAKSSKTAEFLLDKNADINAKDKEGKTALNHIMAERAKLEGQSSQSSINKAEKYDKLIAYLQANGAV